jgi:hypothetical protein
VSDQRVVFGQNPNQERHAFRYTDALGLDRDVVMEAILAELQPRLPLHPQSPGKALFVGTVSIDGLELVYHAYPVSEELVNVGRITGP